MNKKKCIFPSYIAHCNLSDRSHSEYTGVSKMVSKKAARISIFGNFNSFDNVLSISTTLFCIKTVHIHISDCVIISQICR